MSQKMVPIAKIGAPYRLKGELKLYLLSDTTTIEDALDYGAWSLKKANSDQWQLLSGEQVYRLGQKLLIQFPGVDSRELASSLTNGLIGVPRDALKAVEKDEYYWSDLIGMQVINHQGDDFGIISNILETGANEVLCCTKGDEEYLIPFVQQYVISVDNDKNQILVDWQYDYL